MKDPVIVKVLGLVDPEHPTAAELDRTHAGKWIVHYSPKTIPGAYPELITTPEKAKAKRYGMAEWHALYSYAHGTRPWDGQPNRPITAFNLEIESANGEDGSPE